MEKERLKRVLIDKSNSIIQTMRMMDEHKTKSLLVYDGTIFVGLITIGDLQRAIIANRSFEEPIGKLIDNDNKIYAHISDSKEKIKSWMLKVRAEIMPVLDDNNNLIDIIFWDDLFDIKGTPNDGRNKIDLPVVIMAGGKGTRLKPLTNVIPKPLIPIGDKTIIEAIMDQFMSIGCHKFYMSVNYKSDMIKYYLRQLKTSYDIEFFKEDRPLGTIGSVSLLRKKINSPFFVSNCDSITEQDYRDVYDYHVSNKNDMTIVTMVKSFKIPYGVIDTGKDGLMIDLKEKPEQNYQVNTGVYILNPKLIYEIPEGQFFHITHLMQKVKANGGRIGCFPVSEESWHDMGEWPEYLKMINIL